MILTSLIFCLDYCSTVYEFRAYRLKCLDRVYLVDLIPHRSGRVYGLWVYVGQPSLLSLAPLPTAHCLLCSALYLPICWNSVAPLWLFSIVTHSVLLRKRSYSSPYADCYMMGTNTQLCPVLLQPYDHTYYLGSAGITPE